MTTVEEVVVASPADARRATIEERRATIIGFVLLALAALVLIAFAFGVDSEAEADFGLSLPGERFQGLEWVFQPRVLSITTGVILATLGAQRLMRRQLKKTNLVLGIGLGLFTLSFLAWAAAGGSFSMVGMLRSMVISSGRPAPAPPQPAKTRVNANVRTTIRPACRIFFTIQLRVGRHEFSTAQPIVHRKLRSPICVRGRIDNHARRPEDKDCPGPTRNHPFILHGERATPV